MQSQNKRIFGILLFLTRRSCIEIGGSDVVGGQDQVQRVQPTRPRTKAEVACLGIKEVESHVRHHHHHLGVEGVEGHVQQATSSNCHLLGQRHL